MAEVNAAMEPIVEILLNVSSWLTSTNYLDKSVSFISFFSYQTKKHLIAIIVRDNTYTTPTLNVPSLRARALARVHPSTIIYTSKQARTL